MPLCFVESGGIVDQHCLEVPLCSVESGGIVRPSLFKLYFHRMVKAMMTKIKEMIISGNGVFLSEY